jgi:hypothetical protein
MNDPTLCQTPKSESPVPRLISCAGCALNVGVRYLLPMVVDKMQLISVVDATSQESDAETVRPYRRPK